LDGRKKESERAGKMHSEKTKRIVDIVGASIGLVVLSPLLAALAVAIRITLGRPVLFRQIRIGKAERPFVLYKLRTMREAVGGDGQPLIDQERIEPFGRFLRRTSLDETPELVNVLKGDMSLVGPRPLLPEYLPRYSPQQARRHEVKPGITGWAQVNGRNRLSWQERFELDVWYVDHWSWRLDAKVVALTLRKVLGREGINAQGHVTMPPFTGSKGD
jgi:sugar transferase EpsL